MLLAFSLRSASGAFGLSGRAASGAFGLSGRASSGTSALYLCFTLRPAIFNSLRPVTVGSGRIGQFQPYRSKSFRKSYQIVLG